MYTSSKTPGLSLAPVSAITSMHPLSFYAFVTFLHIRCVERLDCCVQERMKHLSWRRGIARGTFSSFHVVRDVNNDTLYVVKAMYIRSPAVEPRVMRAVEEIQVRANFAAQGLLFYQYFSKQYVCMRSKDLRYRVRVTPTRSPCRLTSPALHARGSASPVRAR